MNRRIFAGASLSLILLGLAAEAAAPKSGHTSLNAAPIWTVDKPASRLGFKAAANSVGFDGQFKRWDAQIAFDPKNLKASHATVTVSMASAVTGDPTRDQMLPTADWFDVRAFGKAVFDTTAITETGPGHYLAGGDLTLHGVKRHLDLPFTLTIAKDVARMDATVVLNRFDFGVGKGQAGGAETVAPQVTVIVKLTAKKAH